MRRTLIGMAIGLVLPLGLAHASVESDLKAGVPMQTVFTNALASNISIEAALTKAILASPDQAYAAITAAIQLSPDQAANIVSAALNRQYNLNPANVVGAALQGAPDKAGIIVPTAIVRSPSYFTVPIVQRALAEGVDGSKFVPQAMRISPRQADTILTQALRSAPQQTKSIMEAVISDQSDKTTDYVRTALAAKAPPGDVLVAAFKVSPRQSESIEAIAIESGVDPRIIASAAQTAGASLAGDRYREDGYRMRQANVEMQQASFGMTSGGGGGGFANPGNPVSAH